MNEEVLLNHCDFQNEVFPPLAKIKKEKVSPEAKTKSPASKTKSPASKTKSPAGKTKSPAGKGKSPCSKVKSPAAKNCGQDDLNRLIGKFKTQMVLLQRKRVEKADETHGGSDTPYLLEIQSNCDWEGIRSQLLSKVSAEMASVTTKDDQPEYPNLTSFKIGTTNFSLSE